MKLEEHDNNITRCPECHTKVIHEPSADEMKVLTEEARCRLIKALKVQLKCLLIFFSSRLMKDLIFFR